MTESRPVGLISWTDLTVPNCEEVRDFYSAVVGWEPSPVGMGEYNDFCMNSPATGDTVAGICHARGINADLPPQWLVYITVVDLEDSLRECKSRGGEVMAGPRDLDGGRCAVIRDPAGAVAALFEAAAG